MSGSRLYLQLTNKTNLGWRLPGYVSIGCTWRNQTLAIWRNALNCSSETLCMCFLISELLPYKIWTRGSETSFVEFVDRIRLKIPVCTFLFPSGADDAPSLILVPCEVACFGPSQTYSSIYQRTGPARSREEMGQHAKVTPANIKCRRASRGFDLRVRSAASMSLPVSSKKTDQLHMLNARDPSLIYVQ